MASTHTPTFHCETTEYMGRITHTHSHSPPPSLSPPLPSPSLSLSLRFKKRVLIQQLEQALEEMEEKQLLPAGLNSVHSR